jgi:hypothetical protein
VTEDATNISNQSTQSSTSDPAPITSLVTPGLRRISVLVTGPNGIQINLFALRSQYGCGNLPSSSRNQLQSTGISYSSTASMDTQQAAVATINHPVLEAP